MGAAIVDMFTDAGVRPRAVTITGGDVPNTEDRYNLKVPKRDLAGLLVALFQTGRLKIAEGLALAPVLTNELLNFKVKVNVDTGQDSYEAWRESVHDDLVLSVALACWYGEHRPGRPWSSASAGARTPLYNYDARMVLQLPRGGRPLDWYSYSGAGDEGYLRFPTGSLWYHTLPVRIGVTCLNAHRGSGEMEDPYQREVMQRRFDLLLPSTQRALCRNGIWDDTTIARLSDRELQLLAYIGPVGRQDIRRHFPTQ